MSHHIRCDSCGIERRGDPNGERYPDWIMVRWPAALGNQPAEKHYCNQECLENWMHARMRMRVFVGLTPNLRAHSVPEHVLRYLDSGTATEIHIRRMIGPSTIPRYEIKAWGGWGLD